MSQFSLARFTRVLQNDVLRIAKPVIYGSLALLGITLLIYSSAFESGQVNNPPVSAVLFGVYLLGGGLLFTSTGFQDMHHPLERYQYLMLPCSNVERLASRYLLTGPLFLLYVILTFSCIDWVSNLLTERWVDAREPLFALSMPGSLVVIRVYLLLHLVTLAGAICFRSHALIKTALSVVLLIAGLAATVYAAARVFYWDAFSWTGFDSVKPVRVLLLPLFEASWLNVSAAVGFALWILYVAYRCLRAHEVQDGL